MADLFPWQRRVLERAGLDPERFEREHVRPRFGRRVAITVEIATVTLRQFDRELRRDLATVADLLEEGRP